MVKKCEAFTCLLSALVVIVGVVRSSELIKTTEARNIYNIFGYQQEPSCSCVCATPRRHRGKIVGGMETQPHEFPWLAAIFVDEILHCGGTVITELHILTAAHCLQGTPKQYVVVLGAHNLHDEIGDVYMVSDILVHELYKPYHHDIALMKLARKIRFSDVVRAGCLPKIWRNSYAGEMGVVIGWGQVGESEASSSTLQKVGVPIIPTQECMKYYKADEVSNHMVCAGYPEGKKDSCKGDSGGPLHVVSDSGYLEIIGIVSFGRGCARANTPGVYTKIADYMDWIRFWIGNNCLCSHPYFQNAFYF